MGFVEYLGYEWGCYEETVSGADGVSIGTGYQNTIDIVNQDCTPHNNNPGPSAAQVSLEYEKDGYTDWYLPSKDELIEMYNNISEDALNENIGNFNYSYWSSTEYNPWGAWVIVFSSGTESYPSKHNTLFVRPIRSF